MNATATRSTCLWLVLPFRLALFAAVQGLIALLFLLADTPDPWGESARWWVFTAIITNGFTVYLLTRLYRVEGRRYGDIMRIHRNSLWRDLALSLGVLLLAAPIGVIPSNVIGKMLFGTADIPVSIMFRPLPTWAILVGLLFPISIAFSELPIYFAYAMPRLEQRLHSGWLALTLAALFLSVQHLTLPFIFDWRFIVWRAVMFLPFALYLGVVLRLRPRLLPYLMICHFIIDMLTLSTYLGR